MGIDSRCSYLVWWCSCCLCGSLWSSEPSDARWGDYRLPSTNLQRSSPQPQCTCPLTSVPTLRIPVLQWPRIYDATLQIAQPGAKCPHNARSLLDSCQFNRNLGAGKGDTAYHRQLVTGRVTGLQSAIDRLPSGVTGLSRESGSRAGHFLFLTTDLVRWLQRSGELLATE